MDILHKMVYLSWVVMASLCIGFGPGAAQAHAPNEITWKQDLVTCAAVYALLPSVYCKD